MNIATTSLVLACALALGCSARKQSATATRPAAPDPLSQPADDPNTLPLDVALLDIQGNSIALSDVIGERVAVIDFWATWCRPCQKSLPEVDEMASQAPDDLAVIAVNVGESLENVLMFRQEYKLNLPMLLDRKIELSLHMDIHALPSLLVVDKNGAVIHRGNYLDDAAKQRIHELLGT